MSSSSYNVAEWYLKKHADGAIFGPICFDELKRWAEDAQVAPDDLVSQDRKTWRLAPELPDLEMFYRVEIAGEYYGPTTRGAIAEFIASSHITGNAEVTDVRNGRKRPASSLSPSRPGQSGPRAIGGPEHPTSNDLRSSGRLSDPVKALAIYIIMSTSLILLGILALVSIALFLNAHDSESQVALVIFGGFLLFSAVCLPLAMWLVLKPAFRAPVFYLRAFRSDVEARKLRRLIKAGLGVSRRLCGIRPPKRRASLLSRLLLTTATGFRYLGSEHFDLEAADHNWMARLLASYAVSKFVFVDVRDVTLHVMDEIHLSFMAMGVERCIFITNPAYPEAEWRRWIAETLGEDPALGPCLKLISYPGDNVVKDADFVSDVVHAVRNVPQGSPDVSSALKFAHTRIDPKHWRTSFWEKDGPQFFLGLLATALVSYAASLLLRQWLGPWFAQLPAAVVTVVVLFFYLRALFRARRETKFQARFRRLAGGGNPRWRTFFATTLTVSWLGVIGFSWFTANVVLEEVKTKAMLTKSLSNEKQIAIACKLYAGDNDGEFPPSLESLVPQYVPDPQIFISPFAPGTPMGYEYTTGLYDTYNADIILIVDKFAPQKHYSVEAHVDGTGYIKRIK